MLMPSGKILSARDCGTIWQLLYQVDGDGIGIVNWDWRNFSSFYEGITGASFYHDYKFGAGREYVSKQLRDRRISVTGEPFNEVVRLEDD